MHLLFCDNVLDSKMVDEDYAREFEAAKLLGLTCSLMSLEALEEGNLTGALKDLPHFKTPEKTLYRGWMLTPELYTQLYDYLIRKNVVLVNSPPEYAHTHYLPNSYAKIEAFTAKSVWTKGPVDDYLNLIRPFGKSALIVKDYVKSEKHNWEDACFIPDATDEVHVQAVVNRFLELRGSRLNCGLVFRQFEALQFLTHHTKSGMPLTKEYRLFFYKNELATKYNYWDEGDYSDEVLDLTRFKEIAKTIQSNFFTMDIAQKMNGEWMIIELGDGQTAGLPENADPVAFYTTLRMM